MLSSLKRARNSILPLTPAGDESTEEITILGYGSSEHSPNIQQIF